MVWSFGKPHQMCHTAENSLRILCDRMNPQLLKTPHPAARPNGNGKLPPAKPHIFLSNFSSKGVAMSLFGEMLKLLNMRYRTTVAFPSTRDVEVMNSGAPWYNFTQQ